jgi:hypothetical protein
MEKEGDKIIDLDHKTYKINHWRNKFEKSIHILLENNIKSNELIEKIKIIEDEKNS